MAKKPSYLINDVSMRGEGLPVEAVSVRKADGKSETRYELANLSAPERVFFSDAVFVRPALHGTRISFVQTDYTGAKARALLEIYLTDEASRNFTSSLVAEPPEGEPEDFGFQLVDEPENSVSYQSNFVRMARGGISACVDFYYASPYSLINGEKKGSAYFDPVARITVTDGVFLALFKYFYKAN